MYRCPSNGPVVALSAVTTTSSGSSNGGNARDSSAELSPIRWRYENTSTLPRRRPSTSMSPDVGNARVLIIEIRLDLPMPFGPNRIHFSPRPISRFTSSTITRPYRRRCTLCMANARVSQSSPSIAPPYESWIPLHGIQPAFLLLAVPRIIRAAPHAPRAHCGTRRRSGPRSTPS